MRDRASGSRHDASGSGSGGRSFAISDNASQIELDLYASLLRLESDEFEASECNSSLGTAYRDGALCLAVGALFWAALWMSF